MGIPKECHIFFKFGMEGDNLASHIFSGCPAALRLYQGCPSPQNLAPPGGEEVLLATVNTDLLN